jgi:methyl-accepting chemotaxis protein
VGNALTEIVGKAYEMDKLAAGVATASSEQTQGISQINVAVGEMDKVVQANAASAEECAAAAAELNAQAGTMREAVAELAHMVSGNTTHSLAAPKSAPRNTAKAFPTAKPSPHATNGHGRPSAPAKPKLADRRNELPMDGDFKDF